MQIPTSTTFASKGTVLNFNLSPTDIERGAEALFEQGKKIQDDVVAQTNPTFANVFIPLATHENKEGADRSVLTFLQSVSTNMSAFEIESVMREDVYRAVRAMFDNAIEMASLGPEDHRLVEKMELTFRRHGLAFDKEKREHLDKIRMHLSELAIMFSHNINEGDGRAVLTCDELEGLPRDFFEGCATEIMAKREETRERMFVVEGQRCPDNIPTLQEAVALRLEAAQLLGYKTHAEFVLEENMAMAPAPVLEFEEDLRSRLNVLADKEIEEIEALKKADKQA
ncbi:metalloendopeptidase, partial [Coemansia pectinata]